MQTIYVCQCYVFFSLPYASEGTFPFYETFIQCLLASPCICIPCRNGALARQHKADSRMSRMCRMAAPNAQRALPDHTTWAISVSTHQRRLSFTRTHSSIPVSSIFRGERRCGTRAAVHVGFRFHF